MFHLPYLMPYLILLTLFQHKLAPGNEDQSFTVGSKKEAILGLCGWGLLRTYRQQLGPTWQQDQWLLEFGLDKETYIVVRTEVTSK